MTTPESKSPGDHADTSRARERENRIRAEVARMAALPEATQRKIFLTTLGAIWNAVSKLDHVPHGLHPADVVEKYLQRGNIEKDGTW